MDKKKILIDAISLLSPFTGIAKYTYENSKRLKEIGVSKYSFYFNYGYHTEELYCSTTSTASKNSLMMLKSVLVKNSLVKSLVRKGVGIATRLFSAKYDLYWQPNFVPDVYVNAEKIVTTVHDFSFYLNPEWHPKERVSFLEKNFWKRVYDSNYIITGSEFTKEEIIKYTKFDADKITVIYHGIDHDVFKQYDDKSMEAFKQKNNLPDKFLLFVGSIEPRKNLITLLKAYNLLSDEIRDEYPLVLVGFKGWENKEVMKEVKRSNSIKYLGYLNDYELAYTYNMASLFIYPSLYEGFGIPPLEAFACGTPVLVSNSSAMPEVCQDIPFYIDPYDVEDIREKTMQILLDETLQKVHIKNGLAYCKKFTWDESAKRHQDLFDKILN